MSSPLWVVCKDSEGSGCFHVVRSLAAAAAVPSTEDDADRDGSLKTPRLSQQGMREARARARALASTGGIFTGAPHDTFVYSSTNDVDDRAPFYIRGAARPGDEVWVVTWGEGGHIGQVVGVWRTKLEGSTAMQLKIDAYKARQDDAEHGGPSYDLAEFPIGAPWEHDTSLWFFALSVE